MEETVGIVPVVKGSGAFKVTLHQRHDAASVLQYLETILGGGELEDPEGYIFLSDSDEKLKEGEGYTFTPDNILHGKMQGGRGLLAVERLSRPWQGVACQSLNVGQGISACTPLRAHSCWCMQEWRLDRSIMWVWRMRG